MLRLPLIVCLALSLTFGASCRTPNSEVELGAQIQAQGRRNIPHIIFNAPVDENSVSEALELLRKVLATNPEAIILEIDSPGGRVDLGFMLIKTMEASPVPIHCIVDGTAASMAFAILQGCTTRTSTARSALMIHEVALRGGSGNAKDYRNITELLRVASAGLSRHCSARLNISFAEFLAKIADGKDWWMTPDEALQVGALDWVLYGKPSFMVDTLRETGVWPPVS